jgi:hypothetical protein
MTSDEAPRRFPIRFLVYGAIVAALLAVAIPSLLRARRSPGESPHLGDVRTMIAAQYAYAAANGGFYDHPRCLAEPHRCIPNYAGPTFLDAGMLQGKRQGYHWTFHPGPPAPPAASATGRSSPSSLKSFAYAAVPVEWGKTGTRALCGDASGVICFTADPAIPPVAGGACAREPKCHVLR